MKPICERLEEVRREHGFGTLLAFVDRMRDAGEPVVYATASRYHKNREPSIGYLVAIVRTFGVSAHWLLTGQEPTRCDGCRDTERRWREAVRIMQR
jgi:hypothetical protein